MMAARLILFFAITSFCLAEEQVAALKESATPALPEEIKSAVVPDAAALAPKMDAPSPGEQAPVSVEPMVPAAVPITLSELYVAAEAGDEAKVKELLKEAVVPNELEPNGDTPLCVSLRKWHPAIALLLLEKQADPNIAGINGEFPVQFASLRRHPFLMEKLMSAGADPNRTFSHPVSAEILDSLEEGYVKNQLIREQKMTPLMVSSARGDVESVALLMKHGAKSNVFTKPGAKYPINFAAAKGYLFVMRLLLGRDPDSEPSRLVTVSLSSQTAELTIDGKSIMTTKVSSGRKGYETPEGRYVITNKYASWKSTIYKVNMPYFMRFNCGEIGLHSGYVTGRPASHGCVRLPPAVAKKMFGHLQVGDEVIVQN